MTSARRFVVAATLAFCVVLPSTFAQVDTGGITGFVTDATGGVIPNVQVTATKVVTGMKRVAATSSEGVYTLNALPPGLYTLEAEAGGFSKYVVKNLGPLTVGQTLRAKRAAARPRRRRRSGAPRRTPRPVAPPTWNTRYPADGAVFPRPALAARPRWRQG